MTAEFQVVLRKSTYDRSRLAEALQAMAPVLGLDRSYAGATVLLKPNLISSMGSALACTHAAFLTAVAAWFVDYGARVRIGDSPAFGSVRGVMGRWGMLEALTDLDVEIVDFRRKTPRILDGGLRVDVAADALDCDFFVNLPKLKAHNQMFITGAVKNVFGIVVGSRKALLHMSHGGTHRQFAELLLQLPSLLPPQVAIVDAIEVMHRSGPVTGESLSLGCVAAAADPVALDTSLLALLQLPKESSPLWLVAASRNHPGCRLENIRFPCDQPSDFFGSGFVAPESLHSIRFNPFRFIVSILKRLRLANRA
jgi:uncharacterized protein (DUF362 family)